MDAGMEVFEGIIIFLVVGGFLFSIALPIILDIIWYKRVKSRKSPKFGPLGIISIIVTVWALLGLPFWFTLFKELPGSI